MFIFAYLTKKLIIEDLK